MCVLWYIQNPLYPPPGQAMVRLRSSAGLQSDTPNPGWLFQVCSLILMMPGLRLRYPSGLSAAAACCFQGSCIGSTSCKSSDTQLS